MRFRFKRLISLDANGAHPHLIAWGDYTPSAGWEGIEDLGEEGSVED